MLDRDGTERDRPFYDTALNTLNARVDIMRFQERQTRMNLLYASLADKFLPFAVKHFLREAESRIGDNCDIPKLTDLYRRISDAAGETLMETLNLRLKQRFLGGVPAIIWKPYGECASSPLWRMVRFLRIIYPYVDSIEIGHRDDRVINIRCANRDNDMIPCDRPLYDVMLDIVLPSREHNL